jgi:hypothetical protein
MSISLDNFGFASYGSTYFQEGSAKIVNLITSKPKDTTSPLQIAEADIPEAIKINFLRTIKMCKFRSRIAATRPSPEPGQILDWRSQVGWNDPEQIGAFLKLCFPISTTRDRFALVALLFPNASPAILECAAGTFEETKQYVASGINAANDFICDTAEASFKLANTPEALNDMLQIVIEQLNQNKFGQIHPRICLAFLARSRRLGIQEFFPNGAPRFFGWLRGPLMEHYRIRPFEDIASLTDFCSVMYYTMLNRGDNVYCIVNLVYELGKLSRSATPNLILSEIVSTQVESWQLCSAIGAYPSDKASIIFTAITSINCDVAAHALVAAYDVGITLPLSFLRALAKDENLNGIMYSDFDLVKLIDDSPIVGPRCLDKSQLRLPEFFEGVVEFDDIYVRLRSFPHVIHNLTIMKDLYRESSLAFLINGLTISTSELLAINSDPVIAVLNLFARHLPPDIGLLAFKAMCNFAWVQGESARLILATSNCVTEGDHLSPLLGVLSTPLLGLLDRGRSAGRIVIEVLADGTIVIRSISAYGEELVRPQTPPGRPPTWAFFYTNLLGLPNGTTKVDSAQMAFHIWHDYEM